MTTLNLLIANSPAIVVMLGIVAILVFCLLWGFRLHRFTLRHFEWAQRLPADSGAWAGLVAGIIIAALWVGGL